MIICMLVIIFLNFYVHVRLCVFYVNFWAWLVQIAAMILLSVAAGRLHVEETLVRELNDKAIKEHIKEHGTEED